MKRSTKWVLGSVAVIGLAGAVAAHQFEHRGFGPGCGFGSYDDGEHRGSWVMKKVSRHLDLDEAQRLELNELREQVLATVNEMREARPGYEEVQSVLGTQLDQGAANDLIGSRLQMVKDRAPELVTAFAGFYDALDQEQQAEINHMIETRMSARDHYRAGHQGKMER